MKHHRNSSKLNTEYLGTYSNIERVVKSQIEGFKLVFDTKENFYSVGTGLYRYKTGRVKRRGNDYSTLYQGTEFYCEEMNDKTAIFKSIEDLEKFYPTYKENKKLSIIKITLTGILVEATVSNQFHTCKIYAGSSIKSIKR